ncbi:MAG: hypothetical protein VX498_11065 [Myxococcota bacterium]|nr:hypothetical protein [Myxococcota bacterium]
MNCPDPDLLTLVASLDSRNEADESEVLGDWTLDELRQHFSSCTRCREQSDDWSASLGHWQEVDLVRAGDFDAAYFEELAGTVERTLDGLEATHTPIKLSDRRLGQTWTAAMMSIAAVALLGLGLLWQKAEPTGETTPLTETSPRTSGNLEGELEAQGREIGRQILAAASAGDGEGYGEGEGLWTSADLLSPSADDEYDYFYSTSIHDIVDSLETDEVRSIISRL